MTRSTPSRAPTLPVLGLALAAFCTASLLPSASRAQERRIALLPIGGPGLTAEIAQRHLGAIVQALQARDGVRVLQVTDPRRVTPFAECERDDCRGAWVDQHSPTALGVVVARIERPEAATAAGEDSMEGDATGPTQPAASERPVHVHLESYDATGAALPPPADAVIPPPQLSAPGPLIRAAVNALTLPAPPPRARVLLAANAPGAAVLVDDHPVGEVPLRPLLLPPGQHRLRVTASGFAPFDTRIELTEGERLRLDVDLEPLQRDAARFGEAPGRRRIHWAVWVGTGAAALLLGTVLAVTLSGRNSPSFPVPPIQP